MADLYPPTGTGALSFHHVGTTSISFTDPYLYTAATNATIYPTTASVAVNSNVWYYPAATAAFRADAYIPPPVRDPAPPPRRTERIEAERAALELLQDHLDEQQRQEYDQHRYFHVHTADGARRYRIKRGFAGNVMLVEQRNGRDQETVEYCIHPAHGFPCEDAMLTQKLLLEANEEEFLRIANATRLVPA